MYSKLAYYLSEVSRRMWFRATAFSVAAVLSALASIVLAPYIPVGTSDWLGANAVEDVLTIIASSMLAVTTFSLGIAVSAYNSAASHATPRATKLLVQDATTQIVLSTFLGAFLFSLVGIVALHAGVYGAEGRVVLFFSTILVILLIVAMLLRWIGHLTEIGRMDDTLERIEAATKEAIDNRLSDPFLGCNPMPDGYRLPHGNHPVHGKQIGYVQHVDVGALSALADEWEMQLCIAALPGAFIDPARELMMSERRLAPGEVEQVEDAFTIAPNRNFLQDPRFGVLVLSETASRALSPAVNDHGTAIAVIGRLVRLLNRWNVGLEKTPRKDVVYPRVYARGIAMNDLFDDAFTSIARDAAGIVEVNIRLQKAFAALTATGNAEVGEQAGRHADLALARARVGLTLEDDRHIIEALRQKVNEAGERAMRDT